MQGGPRHSLAANAMAGWASSDAAATHQRSGTTIINGGKDEPTGGHNTREVKQVHAIACRHSLSQKLSQTAIIASQDAVLLEMPSFLHLA